MSVCGLWNYGLLLKRGKTKGRDLGEGFNIANAAEKSKKMDVEYKAYGIGNQHHCGYFFKSKVSSGTAEKNFS